MSNGFWVNKYVGWIRTQFSRYWRKMIWQSILIAKFIFHQAIWHFEFWGNIGELLLELLLIKLPRKKYLHELSKMDPSYFPANIRHDVCTLLFHYDFRIISDFPKIPSQKLLWHFDFLENIPHFLLLHIKLDILVWHANRNLIKAVKSPSDYNMDKKRWENKKAKKPFHSSVDQHETSIKTLKKEEI